MRNKVKKIFSSILLGAFAVSLTAGLARITLPRADEEITVHASSILAGFTMDETAAVRNSAPNGIRFTTFVPLETQAKIEELNNVEYGTLMLPKDMLVGELTRETENVLTVKTQSWRDEDSYVSALVGKSNGDGTYENIPESYYNRPIAVRSYATGTDANGNTITYYTENTAVRSIGYVAQMATIAGESSSLLTTIVNKTTVEFSDAITLSTIGDSALLYNTDYDSVASAFLVGGMPVEGAQYTVTSGSAVAIENGQIVAKEVGTATVSATASFAGNNYSGTITVTVNNEATIASDYAILVPQGTLSTNYAAPVHYAATDMQKLFAKATGVTLPILEETGIETTKGKYISVGGTKLASDVSVTSAKKTASAVKVVDNTVFLKGNTDEGTMYGVYELLGSWFGYEYYAKDTYSINNVMALDLPDETEYVPSIEYNISPSDDISSDDNLLNKYKMNNWYSDIMVVNGSRIHNTFNILPPFDNMESSDTAGNYANHPKWYTRQYWGTSRSYTDDYDRACPYELCFNAGGDSTEYQSMLSTAIKAYTDALAADTTLTKASLSIRDNVIWCQCSACCDESGAYKETPTDAALDFLNDVCAGIRTWLQDNNDPRQDTFRMIFLAYYTTGAAPKTETTLDPYIDVWFAESFAVYTLPMNDSTAAGETATAWQNLKNWASLLDQSQNCTNGVRNNNLLVWTYNSNMYTLLAPYDSFNSMRVNYGLFEGLGVNSVYNYTDSAMSGWAALKKYLASQLAWNATPDDTTWNAWIDNFFTNTYGAGATQMKAWFENYLAYEDTITDKFNIAHNVETDPVVGSIYQDVATSEFFTEAILNTWLGYAEAALNALDKNDSNYQIYYNNIALERLSPVYLMLEIYGDTLDETTKIGYAATFCGEAVSLGVKKVGHVVDIDETIASYDALLVTEGSFAVGAGEEVPVNVLDGEEIASILVNGTNVYADNKINSALATGTYKAIVDGVNGTRKIIELHYADKVIRTVEDLAAVKYTGTNITGYYVLDGNIDGQGATINGASYGWSQNDGFQGVFNGRNYTISNIAVGPYGIFGTLGCATVQNVNFTGISLAAHSSLLAWTMYNTTVENVNVTYAAIDTTTPDARGAGLLVARQTGTNSVWTNVTLDATGLILPNALGLEVNSLSGSEVEIKAAGATVIGYSDNGTTEITEWPTFITFTQTAKTEEETIATEVLAETVGATFTHTSFVAGETVTATVNGVTVTATAYDGYVTVGDLTGAGMTVGNGNYTAIITTTDYILTYTNVFYATQIINDLSELSVVQAMATDVAIYGYYVLGNDIDGNGVSLASTVQIYTQDYGFRGTFDGRGHTISNFNTGNFGIFGNLAYGAVVKNVTLNVNKSFSNVLAYAVRAATITDVTVNVSAIQSTTWYALADEMNNSTVTNLTVVYAESVLVSGDSRVLCKSYSSTTFTNVKVTTNIQNAEMITNSGTPTGVTVTTIGTLPAVEETIATEVLAETVGATFTHTSFVAGETVTATVNGVTVTATAYDGYVTVGDLTGAGMTVGNGNYTAIITTTDYILTYTNVFYATQIINDLSELSVVQAMATDVAIYGYYVLGNDIDGNGVSLASTVQIYTQDYGFRGTFDGRGHTISNFNTGNFGIFGNLAYGAVVKNVTLNVNKSFSNVLAYAVRAATITDVTVNVSAIQSITWYALADDMNNSTVTNLTVVYAESVLVSGDSRVLCKSYDSTTFTNVKVTTNIQNAEMITKSGTPTGVTVTTIGTLPVAEYTVETETYAEESGATFAHTAIQEGDSVTVTVGGSSVTATAVAGSITVDLSSASLALGKSYEVTVSTSEYQITYTNTMYVTKAITTKTEFDENVRSNGGAVITGYYVLANDIENYGAVTQFSAGSWTSAAGFQGTFDGRGHTINNIQFGWAQNGLFVHLGAGAVLKDFSLTNVSARSQYHGCVLAYYALGSGSARIQVSNVTIQYSEFLGALTGVQEANSLFVGRTMQHVTFTNVTLDASNLDIPEYMYALSQEVQASATFSSCVVKANSFWQVQKDSTTWISGVTFEDTGDTVTTELYVEEASVAAVTFSHTAFAEGDSVTATANGVSVPVTVAAGSLTADLSGAGFTLGELYSLAFQKEGFTLTYTSVMYVTQAITTVDEFNTYVRSADGAIITGYYVLANDLNYGYLTKYNSGSWTSAAGFQGTFDGRGRTIDNLNMGWAQNGLFVHLGAGAILKNFSITNITTRSGYNMSVLAHYALGSGSARIQISDVTLQYKEIIASATAQQDGSSMLIGRTMQHIGFSNVTIDASGLDIPQYLYVLSQEVQSTATFSNCVVKANSFSEVARGVTTWPSGVTYTQA